MKKIIIKTFLFLLIATAGYVPTQAYSGCDPTDPLNFNPLDCNAHGDSSSASNDDQGGVNVNGDTICYSNNGSPECSDQLNNYIPAMDQCLKNFASTGGFNFYETDQLPGHPGKHCIQFTTLGSQAQLSLALAQCKFAEMKKTLKDKCDGLYFPPMPETCGDGKITGEEVCDTKANIGKNGFPLSSSQSCSHDCKSIDACGDGQVTGDELCDGNLGKGNVPLPQGTTCDPGCKGMTAGFPGAGNLCGNGKLDLGEVCDGKLFKDPHAPSSAICSNDCKFYFNFALAPQAPQVPLVIDPNVFKDPSTEGANEGGSGDAIGPQEPAASTSVCLGKMNPNCAMGCSFIPGAEGAGSSVSWVVFAIGLAPLLRRRFKR